jgi:hypothetical protein
MGNRCSWVLGFLLVVTGGCVRRVERASLPDLVVPVSCALEIRLIGCDARVSPPKCKGAWVRYRRGCEEIVVKK